MNEPNRIRWQIRCAFNGFCKRTLKNEAEKSFCVAGKEITAKLLAEALHSLPDDKREAVLLYYFFEMNDAEIAKLMRAVLSFKV